MNQYQITNRMLKLQHCLIPEARRNLKMKQTLDNFNRYTGLVEELELYRDLSQHPNPLEANHVVHFNIEPSRESGVWEGFKNEWRQFL